MPAVTGAEAAADLGKARECLRQIHRQCARFELIVGSADDVGALRKVVVSARGMLSAIAMRDLLRAALDVAERRVQSEGRILPATGHDLSGPV